MKAIISAPDDNALGTALETEGVETVRVDGVLTRPELEEAGVTDADLLVLTDVGQATAIAVAKDINDDLRVVVYDDDTIPEFARGQADLIVDPALLGVDAVAEELAAS